MAKEIPAGDGGYLESMRGCKHCEGTMARASAWPWNVMTVVVIVLGAVVSGQIGILFAAVRSVVVVVVVVLCLLFVWVGPEALVLTAY